MLGDRVFYWAVLKKDIFDPIADDDDIDRKYNPFDVDTIDEVIETTEQLMSQITFEGSTQLETKLKALVLEFIDVFATKVRRESAAVEPMKIVIDDDKWRLPCNRAPPRKHSEEKQKEIRKQVDVLLFGTTDNEYLSNTRKVLGRLRENNVTANPAKNWNMQGT